VSGRIPEPPAARGSNGNPLCCIHLLPEKEWQAMNRNKSVVLITGLGSSRRLPLIAALQLHGYETLEAECGFEALQRTIDSNVDLLITDDEMPGLTGRELIGIVRRHRAVGHCLLISDSDQIPGDAEFTDGKAGGFLVAPFEPEQLLLKIHAFFFPGPLYAQAQEG
jgi:two-component system, chemotaxis family, chemotaxis protein CheY